MPHARRRRAAVLVGIALLAVPAVVPAAHSSDSAGGRAAAPGTPRGVGPNPFLAMLPDPAAADVASWKAALAAGGQDRAARRDGMRFAEAPLGVVEQEPAGVRGRNDTQATAEAVPGLGSGAGQRVAAEITGTLGPPAQAQRTGPFAEDDGSIPLASVVDLAPGGRAAVVSARIGDGPHGAGGSGTGDFDMYAVAARAGQELTVAVELPDRSRLDSVIAVLDAAGREVAFDDSSSLGGSDALSYAVPADGTSYVLVAGDAEVRLPPDPFDAGSGGGAGSEGPYEVTLGLDAADADLYAVDLQQGDVLGGSLAGAGTRLRVLDPLGQLVVGSELDASGIYPAASPLPGGGNAVLAHVATRSGPHVLVVTGGRGRYDLSVQARRPGLESRPPGAVQTIFLDLDGARVDTSVFGGNGPSRLSPLSAFLRRWRLTPSQYDALVNRIIVSSKENLVRYARDQDTAVRVLNSRDHPDPFGRPDVSRVVIGGTIAETGVDTIAIAQSIDPGNYETEETALVLLDELSAPAAAGESSLNSYLRPSSDPVRFLGTALGNAVAHEAGHYLGSFHVDQFDETPDLMDQGGNFPVLFGVGPDGVGGTPDDVDVDFGLDAYKPGELFTGTEDTKRTTRWALSPPR